MSDQLNAWAIFGTTWILKTIHAIHPLIYSNKAVIIRIIMMVKLYSGNHEDLNLLDICLTGEAKPRRKPHPGNLSRPGIEPGSAAWQARMLPPASQRSTFIDLFKLITFVWNDTRNTGKYKSLRCFRTRHRSNHDNQQKSSYISEFPKKLMCFPYDQSGDAANNNPVYLLFFFFFI